MIIVLDSNVFISALIKDSLTRKLITNCKEWLIIPEYSFYETRKHEKEILLKSKLSKKDYEILFNNLLRYIFIIPNEIILPYREEALKIIKNIDINDVLFIATALAFKDSIIWSDDKKLKKQNKIKIVNTSEIINIIK